MIKICPICKCQFSVKPSSQVVTCGCAECKAERKAQIMRARQAQKRITIPCAVCGALFSFPRCEQGHHATCSKECGVEYRRRLATERAAARKNLRKCAACGKEFQCAPSSDRQTCSRTCAAINRRLVAESNPEHLAVMRAGVAASPILQPDERHVNAKEWSLRSPAGDVHEFRNLRHFLRTHAELFDPCDLEPAHNPRAAVYLGRLRPNDRLRQCHQWHGWTWAN